MRSANTPHGTPLTITYRHLRRSSSNSAATLALGQKLAAAPSISAKTRVSVRAEQCHPRRTTV